MTVAVRMPCCGCSAHVEQPDYIVGDVPPDDLSFVAYVNCECGAFGCVRVNGGSVTVMAS
jgi:hypothetical protein